MNIKIVFYILFTLICLSCKTRKDVFMVTNEYLQTKKSAIKKPGNNDENSNVSILSEADIIYFSRLLDVPTDVMKNRDLTNHKLYAFTKEWMGTPYYYGGHNDEGIDCSAFMQRLFVEVYDRLLARTATEMAIDNKNIDQFKSKKGLKEGDLVFFRSGTERIATHVGVYLKNGKFLSATVSKGVTIADLDQPFWRKSFLVCGRLKSIHNE